MSKKAETISGQETLERYVRRARRVAEHSLLQDHVDLLERLARDEFRTTLRTGKPALVCRELPPNEEIFESLIARLRPLTIEQEHIYYQKVLAALKHRLEEAGVLQEEAETLEELRKAWVHAALYGRDVRAYAVQVVNLETKENTGWVSDTQLGAGWVYSHSVHEHAKGPKAEAKEFGILESYAAATRLFSRLALATIATLKYLEDLEKRHILTFPRETWEVQVTVDETEIVEEAQVFSAPLDAERPGLQDGGLLPEEWTPMSVTEAIRAQPRNQLELRLDREAGTIVTYDAAIVRRAWQGPEPSITVMIEDSVILHFKFSPSEVDDTFHLGVDVDFKSESNRQLLAQMKFRLSCLEAEQIVLARTQLGEGELPPLPTPQFDDSADQLRVMEETYEDLVDLEQLQRDALTPCLGKFGNAARHWLRIALLARAGYVVRTWWRETEVLVQGDTVPRCVRMPASRYDIGGCEISVPELLMWHPAAGAERHEVREQDPEGAARFRFVAPQSEFLFTWSPQHVKRDSEGEPTVVNYALHGVEAPGGYNHFVLSEEERDHVSGTKQKCSEK